MANNHQNHQTRSDNGTKQGEVVVVVVPFLAQGHLNQLLHLSRLISTYNLPVHFISTTTHCRQAKLRVQGWDPISTSHIHFHELQTPHFLSPPPNSNAPTKFPSHLVPLCELSSKLREPFTKTLSALSPTAKRVIVVYDYLMGSVVQDAVSFPNTEAYVFHCTSAFSTFSMHWEERGSPTWLDEETETLLKRVPSSDGCFTMDFIEFLKFQAVTDDNFNSGALHDTSKVIEGKYFDLVTKEAITGTTKQWAVGPFNPVTLGLPNKDSSKPRLKLLEWLDKQEANSVIYVSFGTTTSLSNEEIQELAIGLEKSEQKFIWVLRDADKGNIFEGEVRRVELPKGYEERVNGLVVRDWAPQLEILGHPSTGGFMSHCGWNSSIESISMGVPIAAWPMHSDQPRNAFLITDVLKIGLVVKDWARRDELVTSLTIVEVVRKLMATKEGDEIRKRAAKLGGEVRRSVAEGGLTKMELDSFIAHITR